MSARPLSPLFRQFVDDELLRAPMLFDQVLDGVIGGAGRQLAGLKGSQRNAVGDMLHSVQAQRARLVDYFMHSLREQVQAELTRRVSPDTGAHAGPTAARPQVLALVDEEEVAVVVELSHAIEGIKSTAEYELRELQTFVAAMFGDLDMAQDHNPFRPATYARATWVAAQALPLSRGHQIAFMRECAMPLAQLLRTGYAASTSRLESQGVEPAAYRTLILPSGSRRGGRSVLSTYSPDLHRISETMPAPLDTQHCTHLVAVPPPAPRTGAMPLERWTDVARGTTQRADRQAIELVSRLFEAMIADRRVPQDVTLLISRLHGPAMRLAIRDRSLLDHDRHPLWRYINQLVFIAEMTPHGGDPERLALLRTAQATIDQLASEAVQHTGLYRWAWDHLQGFLDKRMQRRLATLASQVGALQKSELKLKDSRRDAAPSTLNGPLDAHQLDTVPAEFIDSGVTPAQSVSAAEAWLAALDTGDWARMFLQGRWLQAQLLWRGEQGEYLLFGDGASDETWAVRSRALALMHSHGLVKTLRVRSIVGSAAQRVQQDVAAETAA
ncbi:MAG: DUF1631 family protein [Betaproteobacteria bacterium]